MPLAHAHIYPLPLSTDGPTISVNWDSEEMLGQVVTAYAAVKKERKSHRADEIAWQPTKKASSNKTSPGAKLLYETLGCAMDSDSDSD